MESNWRYFPVAQDEHKLNLSGAYVSSSSQVLHLTPLEATSFWYCPFAQIKQGFAAFSKTGLP
jgi:hypothetical protein